MATSEVGKSTRRKKECVWTETELKYLALVLADEKTQYAVILETLALKKSANNEVFKEIARVLERYLSSEEFNQENEREKSKSKGKRKDSPFDITPARLRVKYKFLRTQWQKLTDHVKKGSGKAPIEEPKWFTILNPIFSDTMGDMDVASSPSDVLSHCSTSDEETDTPNTGSQDEAEASGDSVDEMGGESSSSSSGTKRKKKLPQLQAKPCIKKKVRSQTQAIQEMAKSFSALGESQQRRSELMVEAEKERQAEFLKFQREQAELKMMEVIMKFTNPPAPVHYQHGSPQVAQQPTTHSYYNSVTGFNQLTSDPSQMASHIGHLTNLDYQYNQD